MFYYIYQVTNNLNGKIYVGVHKTNDMNDGYMGSGKIIRSAIAKHGISNFSKVILETFESAEAMYAREKEVVNEDFLLREDTYNLRRGGTGGFDYINKHCGSQGERMNTAMSAEKRIFGSRCGVKSNKLNRTGIFAEDYISPFCDNNLLLEMQQRSRSKESIIKRKITYENIGHQVGENNSQFGTMWITNGVQNVKIKKSDSINIGWRKGRTLKLKSPNLG